MEKHSLVWDEFHGLGWIFEESETDSGYCDVVFMNDKDCTIYTSEKELRRLDPEQVIDFIMINKLKEEMKEVVEKEE